jgi:hypothetical protein
MSARELPEYARVRSLLREWTGHDVGQGGSLVMQNASIELIAELASWKDKNDDDDDDDNDGEVGDNKGDGGGGGGGGGGRRTLAQLHGGVDAWVAEMSTRGTPDTGALVDAVTAFRSALDYARVAYKAWQTRAQA